MAVGDTVGNTFGATTTITPAAGVELMITYVTSYLGSNSYSTIGSGGQSTSTYAGTENSLTSSRPIKVFIRNAFTLSISGGGANPCAYSGIQIK